jgi:hypothetical protein
VNSRSAGQRACDAGWPVVRLFATRLQSPTPAAQSSTDKNPHGIAQLVLQFTQNKSVANVEVLPIANVANCQLIGHWILDIGNNGYWQHSQGLKPLSFVLCLLSSMSRCARTTRH